MSDASVDYVIAASPGLDPREQYAAARASGHTELLCRMFAYFRSPHTLDEANPQRLLDRGVPVALPPVLLLHSTTDPDSPRETAERFGAAYQAAGGKLRLEPMAATGCRYVHKPGSASVRALQVMQAFVAQQGETVAPQPIASGSRR